MINCYLVADAATLEILKEFVGRYPFARLSGSSEVSNFDDFSLFSLKPQVVFVPMLLRDRLAPFIANLSKFSSVVYLADTDAHAYAAFEDGVFDYLVAPLSYERFERCLHKYLSLFLQQKSEIGATVVEKMERFFVKTDGKDANEILVDTNNLVWVEAYDNCVLLRMGDGVQFKCFCTMREMEEALPGHFLRIHKSFIINCHKVATINGFKVSFAGLQQRELVVGVTYRKAFLERKNEMAIRKTKTVVMEKTYQHIAVVSLFLVSLVQDSLVLALQI